MNLGDLDVRRPARAYDLELDTSQLSPTECADAIKERLRSGPTLKAFARFQARHQEGAWGA